LALAAYHWVMIPSRKNDAEQNVSMRYVATTLIDVIRTFFQKSGIWMAIAFTILFRAGEGQLQAVGRLFLIEARDHGGLGLTTSEVGIAYGTFATLAFIGGSIFGGYFADRRGLKKSMFIMILAMNVPNLTFWYLSAFLPTNIYLITAVLSIEMLGYGFGYTGLILYMMQVIAPGKYPTAHYALATGIMALGFNVFQMYAGRIQESLGYHNFFIWCVASALPVLILSLIVKIDVKEKTAI
jgi:PAT family beta-lactamase induction signal transducer AmpG